MSKKDDSNQNLKTGRPTTTPTQRPDTTEYVKKNQGKKTGDKKGK